MRRIKVFEMVARFAEAILRLVEGLVFVVFFCFFGGGVKGQS